MAEMGRPKKVLNMDQLKQLMRLRPTLADTAAFFEVTERTIERKIREEWDKTFVEFREENMVHTRLGLVRKMVEKAMAGDNYMLIWCSKNILGWSDKHTNEITSSTININVDKQDLDL